jgi:hypothetical protein
MNSFISTDQKTRCSRFSAADRLIEIETLVSSEFLVNIAFFSQQFSPLFGYKRLGFSVRLTPNYYFVHKIAGLSS